VIQVALKGLLGRKLRAVLTAIAIVLGVAMMSGTYILTDTIQQSFHKIFAQVFSKTDAVVTGRPAFSLSNSNGQTYASPSFPASVLDQVKAVPDVSDAVGGVQDQAQIIGPDGKAIVFGGAPTNAFSIENGNGRFNPLKLVEGAWPHGNEVVIDRHAQDHAHFQVGQTIGIQGNGPVEHMKLVGIIQLANASGIGGATLAGFDLPTAQRLFHKEGKYDLVYVAAKEGVSPEKLAASLRIALPHDVIVRTGDQQAAKDTSDISSFISFLQTFLLVFAGIALFVGSFVIANSLSITIAQRTREFATLRTLGASRRQVLTAITIEALIVGTLASIVGLLLGFALAKGLSAAFDALGFTLPKNGLVFETRTAVVSLAVGILVTLVASLRPALRATRVPPIAAVREGATLPTGRFHRFRTIGAILVTVLGFAVLLLALFGHGLQTKQILFLLAFGAILVFIGISLVATRLVTPLATALGAPTAAVGGAPGVLARENAQRNPQRTASTAAALMIGIALVTLVAMLAAGITANLTGAVNDIFRGDYAITAENNFTPIPIAAAQAAAKAPGVIGVASVRTGPAQVFGKTEQITAVAGDADKLLQVKWKSGSQATYAELGSDGAIVDDGYAKKHDLQDGSRFTLLTPTGKRLALKIRGIFKPPAGGSPFGPVTISGQAFDANYQNPQNLFSFVSMKGGQTDANLKALNDALASFPNAKAQTRQDFTNALLLGLTVVLRLLYILLALAVVISLFGIVNTLVLTVFERTRELGTLRAIGMTRRQVRRMIRYESVITALIGAVLGIAVGIALGTLLAARLTFVAFSLPVGQLIVFALLAVVVGIIAAIFPARRAANLNPLEALQYE
jgi:putative ABC transport system permease protein